MTTILHLILAALAGWIGFEAPAPEPTPTLFVVPHPDDEMASWAAVQAAEWPVFVLMTEGEGTGHCRSHGHDTDGACAAARLSAWDQFLDGEGIPASDRLTFDFGDGDVTEEEVTHAIEIARATWGEPEVVFAAGREYVHPDHLAVHSAVASVDGPFLRRVTDGEVIYTLQDVERLMACETGAFQQAYDWLAAGGCFTLDASWHGFHTFQTFTSEPPTGDAPAADNTPAHSAEVPK